MTSAPADRIRTCEQVQPPVFLLAPARSYSTVSLALLAGHPQLYGFPEMILFAAPTVGELLAGAGLPPHSPWAASRITGVARAVAQLHDGSQSAAAIQRAVHWLRACSEWPTVALMDHLLQLVQPRTGVEKSPDTVRSNQAITACLQAYPNARYLHLTRHPVNTQQSMLKHWAPLFPPEMPTRDRVRRCLLSWYSSHLRIVQSLRALPRQQWMRIRAEDLLGAPRTWLPRTLDWLRLDHDDRIIERMIHTERWEFAPQHGDKINAGGDPLFMRDPVLRTVAPPPPEAISPSWELTDDIHCRIARLARYLGY